MKDRPLNVVWLKAALVGANWAASEIILGSFLHNLHVPFKGNILTAIGLILMISVSKVWKDRGLFWRSGLICALMKTMSPSAIIFGPMVAIFMEALLLDMSVRILGRNIAGILLGSALAMSWVLFQKIFNLILFYGFNIVTLYESLAQWAQKQLNLHSDLFWTPLGVLLGAYVLFGITAGLAGLRISRSVSAAAGLPDQVSEPRTNAVIPNGQEFNHSLAWLFFSLAGFIITLVGISNAPAFVWVPTSLVLAGVWVARYKRAMRQLSKPGFWISFVVITLLTALMLSSLGGGQGGWKEGLMTGVQMNFRAAIVIMGFSVFGTELYNPVIRNFLAGTFFRQLPAALEVAFESLPFIIANLPEARVFIRRPVVVIANLVNHAGKRFNQLKDRLQARVFVVEGRVGEGKTAFLTELCSGLQQHAVTMGGFLSRRLIRDEEVTGYTLKAVNGGEELPFLHLATGEDGPSIGRYAIDTNTLRLGKELLAKDSLNRKVIFLDEIGRLELKGGGWADSLAILLKNPGIILILAVRSEFSEGVVHQFGIQVSAIFQVSSTTPQQARKSVLEALSQN
jgi:nucleoside-triphosphatase THEP1